MRENNGLTEELKKLKIKQSLDPDKKEAMKMTIQKHAGKKRGTPKRKSWFIWLAAAAVILIGGVLLYPAVINEAILPADDNKPRNESPSGKDDIGQGEPNDSGKTDDDIGTGPPDQEIYDEAEVEELGTESYEIEIEGMTEPSTFHLFKMEPYGIHYGIDEILSDYVIEDFTVTHHLEDEDMGFVELTMKKNASMEDVADEFEQQYNEELEEVSVQEQPEMDISYSGLAQSAVDRSDDAYDSFVGYYVFQAEDDVLIIEYKYMVEAADGISPRIQDMIESIEIDEEA